MHLSLWERSRFSRPPCVTGPQGRRKVVRRPRLAPRLEFLESRCMLSCDAFVGDGTLFVTADDNANSLDVREDVSFGVTVACDGRTLIENASADRVEINSLGGPDTINYRRIADPEAPPGDHPVRELVIDSGDGDDTIAVHRVGKNETITIGGGRTESVVMIDAGAGDDRVTHELVHTAQQRADERPPASFDISVDLGAGQDWVSAHALLEEEGVFYSLHVVDPDESVDVAHQVEGGGGRVELDITAGVITETDPQTGELRSFPSVTVEADAFNGKYLIRGVSHKFASQGEAEESVTASRTIDWDGTSQEDAAFHETWRAAPAPPGGPVPLPYPNAWGAASDLNVTGGVLRLHSEVSGIVSPRDPASGQPTGLLDETHDLEFHGTGGGMLNLSSRVGFDPQPDPPADVPALHARIAVNLDASGNALVDASILTGAANDILDVEVAGSAIGNGLVVPCIKLAIGTGHGDDDVHIDATGSFGELGFALDTGEGDDTVRMDVSGQVNQYLLELDTGAGNDTAYAGTHVLYQDIFIPANMGAGDDALDLSIELPSLDEGASGPSANRTDISVDLGEGRDGVRLECQNNLKQISLGAHVSDADTGLDWDLTAQAPEGAQFDLLAEVGVHPQSDTHPDLYLNIWINQAEAPNSRRDVRSTVGWRARTGPGDDAVMAKIADLDALTLDLDTGGGHDAVELYFNPKEYTIDKPVRWNVRMNTGEGDDTAAVDWTDINTHDPGTAMLQVLDFRIDAGAGNDTVNAAIISIPRIGQEVIVDFLADGGAGDDTLAAEFRGAFRSLGLAFGAGEGNDHVDVKVDDGGVADLVTGAGDEASGAGAGPHVKVFDGATQAEKQAFDPYPGFTGGVRVAVGDINNDGVADIITGAGAGGGPHVKVFDGRTGAEIRSFFAYPPSFAGGVFVAAGDVNGDGFDDIVTGADAGAGPHVKVFDGRSNAESASFLAYGASFQGGVRVAAGDVNGDGRADIITGAGPGGGPHVKVFDVSGGREIGSWLVYSPNFTGGVFVAAGDLDGDGRADIVTGADQGGAGGHVKVFDGLTLAETRNFLAYDPSFLGGVRVAAGDVNGDGRADIITGAGPGAGPHVKVFDGQSSDVLRSFLAYDPSFQGGVFVASGDVVPSPRVPSAINLAVDLGAGDDLFELSGAAPPGEPNNTGLAAIRGEEGSDSISILSSPFRQLTLEGGADPDAYTIQFGRLAGLVHVMDAGQTANDVLNLRGTEFAEQIELTSGRRGAWVARWEGPDLNATGSEVAIETIEIVHEGMEVVEVDAGAGDDAIDASAIRRGPATRLVLRGGDGHDDIRGSRGADVLLGGAGDDFLLGLGGRDLLIGGTGADHVFGGTGDDILIAGTTSYDARDEALLAILAEWTSTRNYQKRVADLADGSGSPDRLNGSVFLNARTVRDDGDEDALTGNAGRDWFFYNADGDGGRRDEVTDQKRDEVGVPIDL